MNSCSLCKQAQSGEAWYGPGWWPRRAGGLVWVRVVLGVCLPAAHAQQDTTSSRIPSQRTTGIRQAGRQATVVVVWWGAGRCDQGGVSRA